MGANKAWPAICGREAQLCVLGPGSSLDLVTLTHVSAPSHRRPARAVARSMPDDLASIAALDALDWTEAARLHAVAAGDLTRVRRGVLGLPVVPDAPGRPAAEAAYLRAARAATLTCPRASISHAAAAIAHTIPVLGRLGQPCLTVPAGTALRTLAAVHLHRATLLDEDIVELAGYGTTRAARAVLDLARERGVPAGVVAADHALREGVVRRNDLAAEYERCARWPGRKAARITLAMADPRAESPLESLSRVRIAAAGLPAPLPQAWIYDDQDRFVGRADFYWDEFGVAGEADGDLKLDLGAAAVLAGRSRHVDLGDTGMIVVRWGWSDALSFDATARRIARELRRGPRPGSPERRWTYRLHP